MNIILLMIIAFLSGCAAIPSNDQPLVQIPVEAQPRAGNDTDFQDISLSGQKRFQVLTNQREIEQQTADYIDHGHADIITRPDGTILYPYGLATVSVTAKRMMYSKIILQQGEKITSAAAGDTTRWHILPGYIGTASNYTPVVLIKPFMGGLQTSLSIITDRRDYDIAIQSVDSGDYTSRIGFYYPQDKADAVNVGLPPDKIGSQEALAPKINIENIRYDYRIQGDNHLSWYPSRVFEDGNKVFIKMPETVGRTQLPVFMAIDRSGQREVVNYRYFKPYYVIDTIFDQGVLILGTDTYSQVVKITRV